MYRITWCVHIYTSLCVNLAKLFEPQQWGALYNSRIRMKRSAYSYTINFFNMLVIYIINTQNTIYIYTYHLPYPPRYTRVPSTLPSLWDRTWRDSAPLLLPISMGYWSVEFSATFLLRASSS